MHRHWLDHEDMGGGGGLLRRWPAGGKMAVALGVLLLLVTVRPSWWAYGVVAAGLVGTAWVGRVRVRVLVRRVLIAEPFVVCVAMLALFQHGGLGAFFAVVVRSTLCVGVLVLLGAVTPFGEILEVFKRARVPGVMVTTIALMHRYLHVLVEESSRMRTARASRTFVESPRGAWRAVAGIVSQLFVRASGRSERIYAAMCSRGWE